jgi:hypothetical protein
VGLADVQGAAISILGGGATSSLWVGLPGLRDDSPSRIHCGNGGAMLNTRGFTGAMLRNGAMLNMLQEGRGA